MTFREILEAHGIPYLTEGHHHCRPGWIQFDCPFCGKGSQKYHMGYSLERRNCSCWRCRGHGVYDTLMELTGKPFKEVKALLGGTEVRQLVPNLRGHLVLPGPLVDLLPAHRNYLLGRGYNPTELAKFWGLRGLDVRGGVRYGEDSRIRLAWRIWIPISLDGKVVSWTTRAISPKVAQRYISAPAECEAINHKTLLFGEDFVRHAVCCCEGPFDAMRIGEGAVASCGVGFTRAQVLRLSRYPVRGVCFDSEPEAQKRAHELVDLLCVFEGKTFNFVLDSKDPGEATDEEVANIRTTLGL